VLILLVLTLSIGLASAGHLWIYNDINQYDSETKAEWLHKSYIYGLGISQTDLSDSYDVIVENTNNNKDAYDVKLEVWVRDNSSINTLQISNSTYTATYNSTDFIEGYHPAGQSNSENHGYYVTYDLGDISAQSTVSCQISISFNNYPGDDFQMHYHAEGMKCNKKGNNCNSIKTPHSHDLTAYIPTSTVIPEFPTIAIPALISLGIIFLMFHRRIKD